MPRGGGAVANIWRWALAFVCLATACAPAPGPDEPYRLGMFDRDGRVFAGLVVGESLVVDLSRAGGRVPATVHAIVAAWDDTLAARLGRLAADAAATRPRFAYDLASLKTLAPITTPRVMLNAAVNYTEHAAEMGAQPTPDVPPPGPIPGIWPREPGDTRHNPYLFPKLASAIIGSGDPILLPPERTRIDWQCELAVVIGQTTRRVSPAEAVDRIFGYTLMNDVSDRGGRGDGRHGSDWLLGKSHDTFAPLGPFVVPRVFVPDPQALAIRFTLNGEVMQDSSTARMTHSVYELVSYASRILTLQPGDVLATGSPAGVGTARATPVYMKDGDEAVCTIERIGTLRNPVRAAGQ